MRAFSGIGHRGRSASLFVIEDRPDGRSVLGTGAGAKSPADGCTLTMISNTRSMARGMPCA